MTTTTTTKVLNMEFKTDEDSRRTVSVNDPLETLDAEGVSLAMESMVAANTLCDNKGNLVTLANSANLTTTTKTVENLF